MVEELRPTEIPLAFGVCFFFLLHPAPLKKSTRAFADSAEELRCRGLSPLRLPVQGHSILPRWPWPDTSLDGVGRVSSFQRSFYFIILVFNFNHSAHIKESVFKNKQKTNPEMYIWDYDKATEEMKPQVSCFKLCSLPGRWRIALADQCTELYIVSFLRKPFWRA